MMQSSSYDFSDSTTTLVHLLRARATAQPRQWAYSFLQDGESREIRLNYEQLDYQAQALAVRLRALANFGERALLLYPPGLEYITAFFGCLYAGVIPVPAYPPRLNRNVLRLQALVADAQATLALTTTTLFPRIAAQFPQYPLLQTLNWMSTGQEGVNDGIREKQEIAGWQEPPLSGADLALLQYTSGSTGQPKGVMVSHANLLHNLAQIQQKFEHTPESLGVSWLPPYHDMGLIGAILQPLYVGFPCILLSPTAFLERPLRWLQVISRYRATSSGGPNFAYELCLRKIPAEQRARLDLRHWRVAFTGAEPVRQETLDTFAAAFAPCGFQPTAWYPCYGLAEATLMVSGGKRGSQPVVCTVDAAALEQHQVRPAAANQHAGHTLTSCGQTLSDQQIKIVHPETCSECRSDQVGEIWLAGPSIAQGYWRRPEETERSFHAYIAETGAGPFLRTGDLGFIHDGHLFVTGRLKDMLIIRGRNHYPQDIEATVGLSHPALQPGSGAAFSVEQEQEERLVVVQEVERHARTLDQQELMGMIDAIRATISEQHELQAHTVVLIKPGSLPKTSSGKIQRRACRAAFLDGSLTVLAISTLGDDSAVKHEVEKAVQLNRIQLLATPAEERCLLLVTYLRHLIAQELHVAPDQIEPERPINTLGLDSLTATHLSAQIEAMLDIAVPLTQFLQGVSIAQLCAQIQEELTASTSAPPVHSRPITSSAASDNILSFAQERFWFLDQLTPGNPAYTIAGAAHLRGPLHVAAFEQSWNDLLQRHDVLRTTFALQDGRPVQIVASVPPSSLTIIDVGALMGEAGEDQVIALQRLISVEAWQPFDLTQGPLVRAVLWRLAPAEHVLLLAFHHSIADGWSLEVVTHELSVLYQAYKAEYPSPRTLLPALPSQYADFARWQRDGIEQAVQERELVYWQRQLAGAPALLELWTDRPRPTRQSFRGAIHHFGLSLSLTEILKTFSQREGVTLFMTLLASFQALLSRYSGQEDIIVGTPVAHRTRLELESMVGCFINLLALRTDLMGNPSFRELLGRVREVALAAYVHQNTPFEQVVKAVQPEHNLSHTPLFQVLFVLQNTPRPVLELPGVSLRQLEVVHNSTQFDLVLSVEETEEGLQGSLQYNTELFEATTITRMAAHWCHLLQAMVANPDQRLWNYPLLSEEEQQQLLTVWNTPHAVSEQQGVIHEFFEAQVERSPDAVAVVCADQHLTYQALNTRSNQLARYLQRRGVGPDVLACLCMERSLELLIGLLGILKSGGAYVPLDSSHPRERLAFLLKDTQSPVLLTQERLVTQLFDADPQFGGIKVMCLDRLEAVINQENAENVRALVHPEHLAYVIYTSGSTGQPKGVLVTHRNLVHSTTARFSYYAEPVKSYLLFSSFAFDSSVAGIFWTLCQGGKLCFPQEGILQDPAKVGELIARQQLSHLLCVPSFYQYLLASATSEQLASLQLVIVAGEVCLPALVSAHQEHFPGTALYNEYGPTEATVWSTVANCVDLAPAHTVPIGRPIANTRIYLLDKRLQLVPPGVSGELYIDSPGIARGYLHRADLTAERFVPHPFVGTSRDESGSYGASEPGARLYRTGDLARYRMDGTIEFLGRLDQQVKVRGFRIEVGEVEALLSLHPAVREAAVLVREDVPGDKRLVAYVVFHPEHRALSGSDLRGYLQTLLPSYMVPSDIVFLETLPLTSTGKVDRRALLNSEHRRLATREGMIAPTTELERQIAQVWQAVLHLEHVGREDNFFDLGGHSLLLLEVQHQLRFHLQRELSLVDLFTYPTISALAHSLEPASSQPETRDLPIRQRKRQPSSSHDKRIAIIGMAGRFPGAKTLEEFWANIHAGVESIATFSNEELLSTGIPETLLSNPRYVKAGGVLSDVDYFDAHFFGYSPREAELMDPQHRLFLETAWHALENAGYDPLTYPGSIGMYAGMSISTYLTHQVLADVDTANIADVYQALIANDKDFLSTRVSYKLNLRGPSIAVQTACSTSLVAVHLACESLHTGQCDMALAGGVSIGIPQKQGYLYQEGGILSPDGHCRPFDAQARGTVRGSGLGIVVLKRLTDALADGDHIAAVIKGSAINNDGALKVGYTAPSVQGQAQVIQEALFQAGVAPETISYVEAHGTATPLGDPIEIAALTQVFQTRMQGHMQTMIGPEERSGDGSSTSTLCVLGSVKSNIGHLDAAAGIAGLLKTVLVLQHHQLPPSSHFQQANPQLDLAHSPFHVNAEPIPWESQEHPRRAGVSSFGIGGTNAHLVLEEAPLHVHAQQENDLSQLHGCHLLILSAKTQAALERQTKALALHLQQHPELDLADVAYTLQVGRHGFAHRRFLVCQDIADAVQALATTDPARLFTTTSPASSRSVVWLFPGQGSQSVGMGQELYLSEPIFREQLDYCAHLFTTHLGRDIRQVLYPSLYPALSLEDASQQLDETWLTQPILFAFEYALAMLWLSWGIQPQALLGHSLGEYVAACLAGVFSLENACRIVALRGQLMQETAEGAMLVLSLGEREVEALLQTQGGELSLAAVNAPEQCVVAGTLEAIQAFELYLLNSGVKVRRLPATRAFHSRLVEPMLARFAQVMEQVKLHAPRLPYLSNVTGTWITAAQATDPQYWVEHMRQPVRFTDNIAHLLSQASDSHEPDAEPTLPMLLEVGPGQSLSGLVYQHSALHQGPVLASLPHVESNQSEQAFLLTTLGKLWSSGVPVEWSGLSSQKSRRRVPLPTYPFERQRYWLAPAGKADPVNQRTRGKRADITNWFYIPCWKQTLPPQSMAVESLRNTSWCWLILSDTCGLATRLIRDLEQAEQVVITVLVGECFRHVGARTFTINPRQPQDYRDLLASLAAMQLPLPQRIVHLWSVTTDEPASLIEETLEIAQTLGFTSLLYLAQTLGPLTRSTAVRLWVISNNLHEVTGEEVLCPEKATVLGPCKVIPQEYPHITCENIDVVLPATNPETMQKLSSYLLAELTAPDAQFQDPMVAYRGERRWVQVFEPLRFPIQGSLKHKLREESVYLITGGLGRIGLALADYLTEQARVKLVLVGRSAFPTKNEWNHWLTAHTGQGSISQKIRALQTLEQRGAEVVVCSADVANLEQMQAVICLIEERFGALHGVIHAAGIVGKNALCAISQTGTVEQDRLFRPKVQGLLTLSQVLEGKTLDFCLLFSSLATILGGLGFATYAAANLFMDTFARQQRQKRSIPWCSVNWDGWEFESQPYNPGMQKTEQSITISEGGPAFAQALALSPLGPQLIVSTGDLKARFDRWINPAAKPRNPLQLEQTTLDSRAAFHPRPDLPGTYVPPVTELEQQIALVWQHVLHIEKIGLHDTFFDLGGHSLLLVQMHQELCERLQREIALMDLFNYPTIYTLAQHLHAVSAPLSVLTTPVTSAEPVSLALKTQVAQGKETTTSQENWPMAMSSGYREADIAIIGVAGRFPGARTLEEFWTNLQTGVEAITFFSDEELRAAGIPEQLLQDPQYVKASGVLDEVDCFDATFFGYSPREAELMDPQHRLFMEAAWHALENAGYDPLSYPGLIGVYAGQSPNTYFLELLAADPSLLQSVGTLQIALGNSVDTLATQVSYKLNLRGPSMNVQTACSTSLVAIHQACRSLLAGECDIALAGGVSVHVPQKVGYLYEEGGILSPDGHCRSFDVQAQGTLFTSGLGIVVLKRLKDALVDGDHIVAVIKGSAINNDGGLKIGYTAPSMQGQAQAIKKALAIAGCAPETISYVEAHGTATPLGDPIEFSALTQAFQAPIEENGDSSIRAQKCALGSVKSNVGHLDAAAGVAGLLKTVLALQHRQVPPSLHFQQANPQLDLAHSPFYINRELIPWESNGYPRRAGVSSFGIGGTNAHLVLEEAPPIISLSVNEGVDASLSLTQSWQLLILSAKTQAALERQTGALATHLHQHPDLDLADVAYTLQVGRHGFAHRRFLICRDSADAASMLATADPARLFTAVSHTSSRSVVWLLPGQGSQYVGMGQELYLNEPTFREQLDHCAHLFMAHLGVDMRQILYPDLYPALSLDEASQQLNETWLTQPVLFAFEYALAMLWLSWGIQPQALLGHSLGEYVAACLAGVFSLEDACQVMALRGRLMQETAEGAMLVLSLREREVEVLLQTHGQPLSLAAVNAPEQCVVAGAVEAIHALELYLLNSGMKVRRLPATRAFHSRLVEPVLDRFAQGMEQVELHAPRLPYLSNVAGTWITAAQATDPQYWVQHMCQPVRFAENIACLLNQAGSTHEQDTEPILPVVLEVGPGQSLSGLVRQHSALPRGTVLASLPHTQSNQSEHAFLLTMLGKLWSSGVSVKWSGLHPQQRRQRVPLPTYPFERQRYWLAPSSAHRVASPNAYTTGPLEIQQEKQEGSRLLHTRPALLSAYVPPVNDVEQRMAVIWQAALGIDQIGRHDTFFELGGHSVLATQLMTQVRSAFQADIPLRHLFETPTIAGLAEAVIQHQNMLEATPSALPTSSVQDQSVLTPMPAQWHLPFPLTDVQQAYWLGRSGELELSNVATHGYIEFEGTALDLEHLTQAVRLLIARHGMLRANILPDGQQQILVEVSPYEMKTLDLRGQETIVVEAQLADLRQQLSHQVLPADQWPLFEIRVTLLDGDRARIHVSLDMLIMDAWSIQLLGRELVQFYHHPETSLPPLELSFRDYILAELALRNTERYKQAQRYWRSRLAELPPAPALPLAQSPGALTHPRFVRYRARLEKAAWQQLKNRAAQAALTPSGVLLAAFAQILATWSSQPRFTLTLTLFNRLPLHPQVNELVGDFTSLTLLTVDYAHAASFKERAQQLQKQLWTDLDHRLMTGVQVLRELAQAQGGRTIPMPVVFTSTLIQDQAFQLEEPVWIGEEVYSVSQTPQVWLDHQVMEEAGDLVLNWDVVEALFPSGLVEAMFAAYRDLLHRLVTTEKTWDQPAHALVHALLPADQLVQRTVSNAPAAPISSKLLHILFLEQAAQRPTHPAVISTARTLSYAELAEQAVQLGRQLRLLGARSNMLVAVVMEKGWEQVVATLGILLTGAAYLPIEPENPPERLAYLLEHGEVQLVLTQSWLYQKLDWPDDVICLSVDSAQRQAIATYPEDLQSLMHSPEDLAYVIYTSGSTGLPKGVMIDHRGAVNTILDINQRFKVGPADRVLALSSLSFDLSVYDIFGTLAAGGTIVFPDAAERHDPAHWAELLLNERVTLWNSVPALLDLLSDYLERHPERSPSSLRLALLSGDWIPLALPERIKTRVGGIEVVSLGGATEASIWSISYPITKIDPSWTSIPYGVPLLNQQWHVLTPLLDPCPVWVPGHLYIGGIGLAKGYWRDAVKTAASFIIHPHTGERLYRTGDLGRYLPDGTIEFLGREDFQVKVQGYRIEPGEIETVLEQHPAVRTAAVVAQGEAHGEKRLVAYIVLRDLDSDHPNIRHFLQGKLPAYMVPSSIVFLEALPLTANGKVNRQLLQARYELEMAPMPLPPVLSPAQSAIIQRLTYIVGDSLQIEQLDPMTNLLELGASSLDMIRIVNRLEKELNFRPKFSEFYAQPTILGLAQSYEHQHQLPQPVASSSQRQEPMTFEILIDPAEREAFKQRQPGLRSGQGAIALPLTRMMPEALLQERYTRRSSQRRFSTTPLPFTTLSALLSNLRQLSVQNKPKYLYASAGGLYPVQTYLYSKADRIEGVAAGYYYYHPVADRLIQLSTETQFPRNTYFWINQPLFDEAAFALFFVAQMQAITPIYGEMSRDFCLIEAGLMAQLLEMSTPVEQLGLCQVGGLDFEPLRALFALEESHVFLYSMLGGSAEDAKVDSTEEWQEEDL